MMGNRKLKTNTRQTTSLVLVLCLFIGFTQSDGTSAHSSTGLPDTGKMSDDHKLSPELRVRVRSLRASEDEPDGVSQRGEDRVRVILQMKGREHGEIDALLNDDGISAGDKIQSFNSRVVELPVGKLRRIAASGDVTYISLDRELQSLGHIEIETGIKEMRQANGNSGIEGKDIGIAIVDSGVYKGHHSLGGRIEAKLDFTGEAITDEDPYGHGTHVAAMAAANEHVAHGAYSGPAIASKIINLRVLDSQGSGLSSNLLKALDWVLAPADPNKPLGEKNYQKYKIRVVNLSLGTLAVDSYVNDPLCIAVRRLVNTGIVVVVAAGNNGKDSQGNKLYGHIHSPGNEPSAITVGAVNTFGTDVRSDDGVATYSSRGPTRSYWTDSIGVRHYDNLIKPDLVAPGNKIIAAMSDGSTLVRDFPNLKANVSTNRAHEQMRLSGTSVAAPVVSGAVALMLQANPKLTPNLVKAILMYTAQPLAGYDTFEQGTGELNVEGAVRLAKLVRTDLTNNTPLGAPLLVTATPPTPQTTIAGHTFTWAQGILLDYTYATGVELITKYQKVYGLGRLLGDGVVTSNGLLLGNWLLMSSGMLLGNNIMVSNGMLLGNGAPLLGCGMLLGNGMLIGNGMLLGNGVIRSDGMLLGNGDLWGDAQLQSLSATVAGDDTPSMPIIREDGVEP